MRKLSSIESVLLEPLLSEYGVHKAFRTKSGALKTLLIKKWFALGRSIIEHTLLALKGNDDLVTLDVDALFRRMTLAYGVGRIMHDGIRYDIRLKHDEHDFTGFTEAPGGDVIILNMPFIPDTRLPFYDHNLHSMRGFIDQIENMCTIAMREQADSISDELTALLVHELTHVKQLRAGEDARGTSNDQRVLAMIEKMTGIDLDDHDDPLVGAIYDSTAGVVFAIMIDDEIEAYAADVYRSTMRAIKRVRGFKDDFKKLFITAIARRIAFVMRYVAYKFASDALQTPLRDHRATLETIRDGLVTLTAMMLCERLHGVYPNVRAHVSVNELVAHAMTCF
jgi:hypothetical protein